MEAGTSFPPLHRQNHRKPGLTCDRVVTQQSKSKNPLVPPARRERYDSTRPGPFASMMCSGPEGMGPCGTGALAELVTWDEAVR